jgi:catechol 2,3-dioxygenase-like lactoylglutathione lyase family enzyme
MESVRNPTSPRWASAKQRCRARDIAERIGVEMSSVEVSDGGATASPPVKVGEFKLEVVVLPVSDVDRAKSFYQGLGWRLDADIAPNEDFRLVQLTPPGSGCSIQFGIGLTSTPPGSVQSLYLAVADLAGAREELAARGAEVSEVFHEGSAGGRFHADGREGGPGPGGGNYSSFATFSDPDGNGWLLQEIETRLPGR